MSFTPSEHSPIEILMTRAIRFAVFSSRFVAVKSNRNLVDPCVYPYNSRACGRSVRHWFRIHYTGQNVYELSKYLRHKENFAWKHQQLYCSEYTQLKRFYNGAGHSWDVNLQH